MGATCGLTRLGHVVELFPFSEGSPGQTRQRPDVVFNIAEGWSGRENRWYQQFLSSWAFLHRVRCSLTGPGIGQGSLQARW